MRYSDTHKERSRARILDAASRQFRAGGSEAVRVADVMEDAGLTHGGFYKHFADKDALLAEAIGTALAQVSSQIEELTRGRPRGEGLRKVIGFYLSEEHLRNPERGCALAALGTEMARMPEGMRERVSAALDAYAERLDWLMPGGSAAERRAGFQVLFPGMAGCLMTARAYAGEERPREILKQGREFFERAFCGDSSRFQKEGGE